MKLYTNHAARVGSCVEYQQSKSFAILETSNDEKGQSDMSKVRVAGFGVSLDGFSAGIEQSLNDPLGKRGPEIFQWFFRTKSFQEMHGGEGGAVDLDDQFAHAAMENFGAFILGRNMFGPVRGPWLDDPWKGWWGDNPPYHAPTFILTHFAHEPIEMEGGTTFYFVTEGIEKALELAKKAAGGRDVKIGGGVSTVRQYLKVGLIDSIHLAQSPALLGQGEALFAGLDWRALGFSVTDHKSTEYATHLILEKA
jgi:dihydrofolate reductase